MAEQFGAVDRYSEITMQRCFLQSESQDACICCRFAHVLHALSVPLESVLRVAHLCEQAVTVRPPMLHNMNDQCRPPLLQIFFPLAPGIESIWEPFQEELQERYDEVQRHVDDVVDGMQHAWLWHDQL